MMIVLLVVATARELSPFLQQYQNSDKFFPPGITIDILVSGIGLTASTYHLQKQILLKRPDCIIQAGVAGCFDHQLPLGSVIAVKQDTIADQSVIELNKLKTLFDLELVPHNQFPFKKGWLVNPHRRLLKHSKLKTVKAVSVNQITTLKQMKEFYTNQFDPVAESMEGAALHFVCLMENIPFLQIRSISNYIGERNKKNWNMKDSIANLNKELIRILQSLTGFEKLNGQ